MTNILKLLPPNNRCVDIPCWNIELARVTGNILQLKCLSSPSWGGNSHFASEVTQPPIFDQKRGHPLGSGVTWWLTCFPFGCSYVVLLYKYTNLKHSRAFCYWSPKREAVILSSDLFLVWPKERAFLASGVTNPSISPHKEILKVSHLFVNLTQIKHPQILLHLSQSPLISSPELLKTHRDEININSFCQDKILASSMFWQV